MSNVSSILISDSDDDTNDGHATLSRNSSLNRHPNPVPSSLYPNSSGIENSNVSLPQAPLLPSDVQYMSDVRYSDRMKKLGIMYANGPKYKVKNAPPGFRVNSIRTVYPSTLKNPTGNSHLARQQGTVKQLSSVPDNKKGKVIPCRFLRSKIPSSIFAMKSGAVTETSSKSLPARSCPRSTLCNNMPNQQQQSSIHGIHNGATQSTVSSMLLTSSTNTTNSIVLSKTKSSLSLSTVTSTSSKTTLSSKSTPNSSNSSAVPLVSSKSKVSVVENGVNLKQIKAAQTDVDTDYICIDVDQMAYDKTEYVMINSSSESESESESCSKNEKQADAIYSADSHPTTDISEQSTSKQGDSPVESSEPKTNVENKGRRKKYLLKKLIKNTETSLIIEHANRLDVNGKINGKIAERTHKCTTDCLISEKKDLSVLPKNMNFMTIPYEYGWKRNVASIKYPPYKRVVYVAPCGHHLRSIYLLSSYLQNMSSILSIDMFTFEKSIDPSARFELDKSRILHQDLSGGKEPIPITLYNDEDLNSRPPRFIYNDKRTPVNNVHIETDPGFLCGCDCTDGCQDVDKCSCLQISREGYQMLSMKPFVHNYTHRRIRDHTVSGIYECNINCACKSNCQNRVVQNGMKHQLQIFKTLEKGWGVRSLDDLPKGTFVTIYVGNMLNECDANSIGTAYGDLYLANLDFIETAEAEIKSVKIGYQSVVDPELTMTEAEIKVHRMNALNKITQKNTHKSRPRKRRKALSNLFYKRKKSVTSAQLDINSDSDYTRKVSNGKDDKVNKESEINKVGKVNKYSEVGKGDENNKRLDTDNRLIRLSTKFNAGGLQEIANDDNSDASSDIESSGSSSNMRNYDMAQVAVSKNPITHNSNNDNVDTKDNINMNYMRNLYGGKGENEMFIMDAMVRGNIGKYFNHSCGPNLIVQNVFVDSHDLRYPWIAFFANQNIKAGNELTWDYHYESDNDILVNCKCGSKFCRSSLR